MDPIDMFFKKLQSEDSQVEDVYTFEQKEEEEDSK